MSGKRMVRGGHNKGSVCGRRESGSIYAWRHKYCQHLNHHSQTQILNKILLREIGQPCWNSQKVIQ